MELRNNHKVLLCLTAGEDTVHCVPLKPWFPFELPSSSSEPALCHFAILCLTPTLKAAGLIKSLYLKRLIYSFFFFANRTKSAFFPPSFLITVGIEAKVGRKSRSWQTNTVNVIPWQGQRGKLSCSQETMAQFFFFWLFFPSWPVIGLRPPSPGLWTGWCPLSRTGDWTQDESERMRHLCQAALTLRSIFDSEITDHTWLTDRPGLGREWWGEVRGSSYPASIFNEVIPKKPCSDTERFIYSLAL